MDLAVIFSFLGVSVLLSLMPGPDNIFVLTESVTKGYKNGIAIAVGLCTGIIIHTTAAATGLSVVLANSDAAFSVLKYLGAGYLLYLAYKASQDNSATANIGGYKEASTFHIFPLIRKGFFMNVLNPKVSLFFVAFLPQFVSTKSEWSPAVQMVALGIVFMLQALVIFSGISLLAGQLTSLVTNPSFWKVTQWVTVIVLTTLAISLALSSR